MICRECKQDTNYGRLERFRCATDFLTGKIQAEVVVLCIKCIRIEDNEDVVERAKAILNAKTIPDINFEINQEQNGNNQV